MELESSSAIAVVGMACRFPGAATPSRYWNNLVNGVESVRFFSREELLQAGVNAELLARPEYVPAGVVLEDVDMFDAGFFGFSPKEAAIMDPQHRHFLECVWEALESAGHVPESFAGSIGVFAGCGMNSYMMFNLLTNRQLMESTGMFLVRHTGNDKDFLATRASYQFNLRGPSLSVQTACSTSLVAIHLASQSLLSGECDMALAGGVTIELPHRQGYLYQEGEILSRDGHCRSFDAASTGTIFGSGVGVVVLRRLRDAVQDGDTIYAVLKGSAINNDGSSKVGYLAPSVDGQAKAISEALAIAGVDADSVTYVETHGTATAVGDPIEISALTSAFQESTDRRNFCAIGSVKSNIGHLDTAAGVASFIKVVQALRHKQIPASLHFEKPNPLIGFENSPFYVNARLASWESPDGPRRAGVSSLGVGGTNAHVILEEAPAQPASPSTRDWQLFALSTRSAPALDALSVSMSTHLAALDQGSLADASFTTQAGRKRFKHRRIVVARNGAEAAAALIGREAACVATRQSETADPSVVFLFPGGGAQYPNMARGLYESEQSFRRKVDECLSIVQPHLAFDLKQLMFPPAGLLEQAEQELQKPLQSILSVFIIEFAMAHLWMAWGIQPKAMSGHSLGEYTAACLAGVLDLEDALKLVLARGRVFERLPMGGMLSIGLAEAEVVDLLASTRLSIAAVNGPRSSVVSGEVAEIDALERELTARDVEHARLRISVAAHSPMLEPYLAEFAACAAGIPLRAPSIPLVSNLTGNWLRADELDSTYWVRHLRQTVRFSSGLEELLKDPNVVVLEVGPGTTLSSLVLAHPARRESHSVVSSIRHPKDSSADQQFVLMALGRLWMAGASASWTEFWSGEQRRRVALPTYPFEHQRYWIEPGKIEYAAAPGAASNAAQPQAITKLSSMDSWFWESVWKPSEPVPAPLLVSREPWLIFCDASGLGAALAAHLRDSGQLVTCLHQGERFSASSEESYTLKPGDLGQCASMLSFLIEKGRAPRRIVYLWPYGGSPTTGQELKIEREIDFNVWTPVALIQALAAEDLVDQLDFTLVSSGAVRVTKSDAVQNPARAMLAGPARVIAQEYPGVTSRWIDVPPSAPADWLVKALVAEASSGAKLDRAVVYRDGQRLIETFLRVSLPAAAPVLFRKNGTYVITGGLGGMALTFAGHLANKYHARVVLLHRSDFPVRSDWERFLQSRPSSQTAREIRRLQAIESSGGEVHLRQADVADGNLSNVMLEVQKSLGPIHGIIHTAGVMRDGIIQGRSRDQIVEVLAPKVMGTLALDSVLRDLSPDFLLLCSSTSALLGLPGQVDYAAANAFLDAYAQSKCRETHRVISVNWGVWSEVGMAAKSLGGADAPPAPLHESSGPVHPLLGSPMEPNAVREPRVTYSAWYRPSTHWVLSEHKLRQGTHVLPGTAYLDLAVAAGRGSESEGAVIVQDLVLIAPMAVETTGTRQVIVETRHVLSGMWRSIGETKGTRQPFVETRSSTSPRSLTISSLQEGQNPVEHCNAFVFLDPKLRGAKRDLSEIRASCKLRTVHVREGASLTRQADHLDFGPRWSNVQEVWIGESQLLAELTLPAEYESDTATHPVHPALLDMAIGCGLALTPDALECADLYVPLSFARLVSYRTLPRHVFSHVRLLGGERQNRAVVEFDATICDERGDVVLEIERFAMRRISPHEFAGPAVSPPEPVVAPRGGRLQNWIAAGIRPDEGVAVIERILSAAGRQQAQLVASSIDLMQLIEATAPRLDAAWGTAGTTQNTAEGDEIERFLLSLWTDLLGVTNLGLDDDFFDLGGQSLIAVRLFSKIRKAYKADLGLATLFEARTVRQLAAVIRRETEAAGGASKPWSCLVPLRAGGTKPILFCVHAIGGNVLNFGDLVNSLPSDQPCYAIQSINLNPKHQLLTNIQDIAAIYVQEMRAVQPQGPYYLCGHSFGGVAAFEMAQQLHAMGHRVALLAMFDTDRPYGSLGLATRIRMNAAHLWRLEPADRKKYLLRKLGQVGARFGKSKPAGANAMSAHVEVSPPRGVRDANYVAYHAYRAQPYPGRVTLFQATETIDSAYRKPNLAWTGVASGGIDSHTVPGSHTTMLREPNVSVLARKLTECLEETYLREISVGPSSPNSGNPHDRTGELTLSNSF